MPSFRLKVSDGLLGGELRQGLMLSGWIWAMVGVERWIEAGAD